jgi:hypothetical protein
MITIDMSETVLCSTNDRSYINICDSIGNCHLDDKLRLEAAIAKIVLSLKEVLLFPSPISVEVRKSNLQEQRYQRRQYGVGENFPSVVFSFKI